MKRHFRIWWLMVANSAQISLTNKAAALLFVSGKIVRFAIFFFILLLLASKTKSWAGYTTNQVIFFFLTFNLIDIIVQMLFREVYRFRQLIVSGDFDLVLLKPVHPLLRSLLGGADFLDFLTLIPLATLLAFYGAQVAPGTSGVLLYFALILNSLLIATAFHIFVVSFGIITTSVDHAIWIYRDLTSMGRIPVDFYNFLLRTLLTFVIPVGVMMTIPAKALMGLLSPGVVIYSFVFGLVFFWLGLRFWHFSLMKYSSASS